MEIYIHIIADLNRFLNLGLYITFDGRSIHLNTLNEGKILLAMNAKQNLDFYLKLVELKNLISRWSNNLSLGKTHLCARIAQQIYLEYNFSIENNYQVQKYGTY